MQLDGVGFSNNNNRRNKKPLDNSNGLIILDSRANSSSMKQ